MSSDTTEKAPKERVGTNERLKRTGIVVFVVVCLYGLFYATTRTREVDANGDVITREAAGDVTITGDDDLIAQLPPVPVADLPSEAEVVEQTFPADGAEILQQQQIGIDLGDVFRVASLSIDGTLLPERELIRRDELNQAFFQPSDGFTFETLPQGRVCARADVVRSVEPETVIRSVEWCFEVT